MGKKNFLKKKLERVVGLLKDIINKKKSLQTFVYIHTKIRFILK